MKAIGIFVLVVILNQYANAKVNLDDLFNSLTNEEKCGQMTQLEFEAIAKPKPTDPNEFLVDENKFRLVVVEKKIGSFFNPPSHILEAKKWQEMFKFFHDVALNETRSKIPILYAIDSIHGASFIKNTVLYPQPLSIASSFNIEIARKYGEIVAKEQRAAGIPWNYSPIMDIGRQPLWPRLWETMGEDVHLVSQMGSSYVKGHQGTDLKNTTKVAVCLKHYLGYSYPLNGFDRTLSYIPENILRQYFLPPFEEAIKAGALTIMINSGNVNGIPGHANYRYLTEILKNELKFEGFTISDWSDVRRLYFRDRLAASPEEAVRIAVMAGLDMSMVPNDFSFTDHCVNLTKKDQNFLNRVNDAVKRILKVKEAVGLFDNPYPNLSDVNNIDLDESNDFNLEATRECIVLAKNDDNFLPISKTKRILVTGPTGNLLRVFNGGWSYGWQGDIEEDYIKYGKYKITIFGAINQTKNGVDVNYVEGANFSSLTNLNEVIEQAKLSDVVVLTIGEDVYAETKGNIDDLTIPNHQLKLAQALYEIGKDVIVVYIGGRPRLINEIVKNAKAVLIGFLPGPRASEAISDIIFGNYNPNGRLPITYPSTPNGYTTYDYRALENFDGNKHEYLYEFGHGLSFTSFEYSDLKLNATSVSPPNGISVEVTVRNTGKIAGKETVLLYLNDEYASESRPNKLLKGFKKVDIEPGDSIKVEFELTIEDMSFVNIRNKKVKEAGYFNVYIKDLQEKFELVLN